MSRALSDKFKKAICAQQTDEVVLLLLTVTHDDLDEDLRFSSDYQDTVSRGDIYTAFPFDIDLPNQTDDRLPRARLSIDNVDPIIMKTIRELSTPPHLDCEVVLASDPDFVEMGYQDFVLSDVKYDVMKITGTLNVETLATEPYPGTVVSRANRPGLI